MENVFTLRGRIVDRDGRPAAGLAVAVVDADACLDDLIGLGRVRADGTFQISFTAAAFRQDWLEREATPDLYLVVSHVGEASAVPFHRIDLPQGLGAGDHDAGDLAVPWRPGETPAADPRLEVAPRRNRAARVDLTPELLERVVAEMAALRAIGAKASEYEIGRRAYQARAEGGRPAVFDPALRPAG